MSNEGYIRLHRKLLDNPVVCKDADHLAVWVWLLMKAAWKESDIIFGGKRVTLRPGDLPPISRKTIASELLISESKVQRILKLFENEHQIEQRTNFQCRLISICSWDEYQSSEQRSGQRVNSERTASEQRVNTIEESKEGNKVKNNISSSLRSEDIYKGLPDDLIEALKDFEKMRKTLKKPLTDRAKTQLLKKLDDLSGGDNDIKIKILEQSIFHSWQGVFELKDEGASNVQPYVRANDNKRRGLSESAYGSGGSPEDSIVVVPRRPYGFEEED